MNTVLALNFILTLIEAAIFIYKPKDNLGISSETKLKYKKSFIRIVCLQWILLSGLRANTVGADTITYKIIFENHIQLSWEQVFEKFKQYYTDSARYEDVEPGYIFLEKLVSVFTTEYSVFKYVIASIFMCSFGVWLYKNSEDPFLSMLIYDGMMFYMFSFTGYRQVISVAIALFWGYDFIKKRKFIPYLIVVLFSSIFHKSSLIYLGFYFMANIKMSKGYVISVVAAAVVMIILKNQLFDYVKALVGYDEYGAMSGFSQRNFIIMFAAYILFAIWRYPMVIKKHPNSLIYYNGMIMAVFMLAFAMVTPTAMRLVYDFLFFHMLLLPYLVQSFENKKDRFIVYSVLFVVFLYFIAFKREPYEFYWQSSQYLN